MNLCLCAAFVGYSYTYFNSIDFDEYAKIIGVTSDLEFYQGFLSFLIPTGAAFGAYFSNLILENFSRK